MNKLHEVPVAGGLLTVGEWGPADGVPVLAVHGISATHMSFNTLARFGAEAGLRLIAPDLRGRGRSTDLPGPYGMAAHAHDLAAVCEALDLEEVIVAGHSMGAFAALVFTHLYPNRVRRGLLIDGGLPLPPPPGATAEALTAAILAPIEARLSAPIPSREAYLEGWKTHPAFERISADLREYIAYDVLQRGGELWASGNLEAIRDDAHTLGTDEDLLAALTSRADTPTPHMDFTRAPHGMSDDADPLYPLETARELGSHFGVSIATVEETNHYTILMSEPGARELITHMVEGES